jgi:AraC family transcriptional regulator
MGRIVRIFEARFGRLLFTELAPRDEVQAKDDPTVVLELGASEILLLNPGEAHQGFAAKRALVFHAATEWLSRSFPAVFRPSERKPFVESRGELTPRIREIAAALAIEALNDRFLSPERLEFMLQELLLSVVETYLAGRRGSSPLWRGSRFEDSRIRRAIALLRAHRTKGLSMDELATQVGLSRSRFYDLFQLCTGFSPRTYLDLLCVEAAISRLSSGRSKIAEVSAELGFSAQSNFTRFFLNQVGVPPSEYRRVASRSESNAE